MLALAAAAACALALYALPLALYVTALGRAAPAPRLQRLLDVGTALALDALVVLTLTLVVTLETAAWVSRGAYLLAAVALAVKHRGAAPRPRARDAAALAAVALAVAVVVMAIVWRLSYELIIWDRDWHVPLTSSLRVQRLPFQNVYLPYATLRYHYLGDVIAAVIQTLSFGVLNAAFALTLAHDFYLCLAGVVLALFLHECGLTKLWLAPLAAVPLVWAGPLVLFKLPGLAMFSTRDSATLCGFTYLNFTTLAYRPHVVVATLFILTVFLVPVVRARADLARHPGVARTNAALLASTAALSLLDEASVLVLALALGVAQQFVPRALHPRPGRGVYLVGAMALLLVAVNRLYDGALSPGGPTQTTEIVATRHLSLFSPSVPFSRGDEALGIFLMDYFPYYTTVGLAGALALIARRRDVVAAWFVYASAVAVALFFALKVEVNHDPSEGHRFLTAIMVLAPVAALHAVVATRGLVVVRAVLLAAVCATALSGYVWQGAFLRDRFYVHNAPPRERAWSGRTNPIGVNCRELLGPMRRERPRLEYAEFQVMYAYAGCQPALFAARRSPWNITVYGALFGPDALAMMDAAGATRDLAAVVCGADNPTPEPACVWARANLRCAPLPNGRLVRCPLDAASRPRFLEVLGR